MRLTKPIKMDEIERKWIVIDANDKVFGRIITEIAVILRGKHKPCYTPHLDCGDYVIVINASKVKLSGNKIETKNYYRHSGYFGGVKSEKLKEMLEKNPEKLFKLATRGMLPKTKLGRKMIKKLKVYAYSEHPHTAQVKGK